MKSGKPVLETGPTSIKIFYGRKSWKTVLETRSTTIKIIYCRKSFKKKHERHDHVDGRDPEQSPMEIKYAVYAWLVYVIFLTPRVLLIFLNFAEYRKKIDYDILGK